MVEEKMRLGHKKVNMGSEERVLQETLKIKEEGGTGEPPA